MRDPPLDAMRREARLTETLRWLDKFSTGALGGSLTSVAEEKARVVSLW